MRDTANPTLLARSLWSSNAIAMGCWLCRGLSHRSQAICPPDACFADGRSCTRSFMHCASAALLPRLQSLSMMVAISPASELTLLVPGQALGGLSGQLRIREEGETISIGQPADQETLNSLKPEHALTPRGSKPKSPASSPFRSVTGQCKEARVSGGSRVHARRLDASCTASIESTHRWEPQRREPTGGGHCRPRGESQRRPWHPGQT